MRTRRTFRPSCPLTLRLEDRVVLNGNVMQVASSVLLQGLNAPVRSFRPHSAAAVSALVDLAFQSFQQDYGSVRATYLASVENGAATTNDMMAFSNYTAQRVNLLAQQVTNSFLLYGPGATRGQKTDSPLPLIKYSINGVMDTRAKPRQIVPLITELTAMGMTPAVPGTTAGGPAIPPPGASATTIALDTIAQDNAIEATRVETLNGVTIIRNGNFGNSNGHSQ